jgi:putative acetyltransferase
MAIRHLDYIRRAENPLRCFSINLSGMEEVSRVQIREDDLIGQTIAGFLREHLENMHEITPPGSVHALDLDALRSPDITFWSAWDGEDLLGCGALKELDPKNGEIKSMRTANAYRRRGIASKILEHIIHEAKRRGYECLMLETGAFPAFAPARSLYLRHGFEYRGPFGDYENDPHSVFMAKKLEDR